jgi:hypothetical protein
VAGGKKTAADLGAWLVFEDESGQGLRPPKGRTWGRRGQTPVVTVTGGSSKRVSLAALIAIRPGCRPRLIYRVHAARRRPPGEPGRVGVVSPEKILANLVKHNISELTALARTRLRRMQYRPSLLEGFLAGTRLDHTLQ